MTLRNYIALLSDPNNIEMICSINADNKIVHKIGYWEEETVADFMNAMVSNWELDPEKDEEEIDIYFKEYLRFRDHLDHEVVQIDVLNRIIWVKTYDAIWERDDDERDPFEI